MSTYPDRVWKKWPRDETYLVSNDGMVKRLARIGCHPIYGNQKFPEREIKAGVNCDGYYRINTSIGHYFVHVMVLETFVGFRSENKQACHGNGNRKDNRVNNLRWDYPRENVQDRIKHGTYQYGEKNPNCHISDETIKLIRNDKLSRAELMQKYKISDGYLSQILNGKVRVKPVNGNVAKWM